MARWRAQPRRRRGAGRGVRAAAEAANRPRVRHAAHQGRRRLPRPLRAGGAEALLAVGIPTEAAALDPRALAEAARAVGFKARAGGRDAARGRRCRRAGAAPGGAPRRHLRLPLPRRRDPARDHGGDGGGRGAGAWARARESAWAGRRGGGVRVPVPRRKPGPPGAPHEPRTRRAALVRPCDARLGALHHRPAARRGAARLPQRRVRAADAPLAGRAPLPTQGDRAQARAARGRCAVRPARHRPRHRPVRRVDRGDPRDAPGRPPRPTQAQSAAHVCPQAAQRRRAHAAPPGVRWDPRGALRPPLRGGDARGGRRRRAAAALSDGVLPLREDTTWGSAGARTSWGSST